MASQNSGPGLHEPALHDGDEQGSLEAWCLERSSSCEAMEEGVAHFGATPQQSTATTEFFQLMPVRAAQLLRASSSSCSAIPRPRPNPLGFPPYVARPRSPPRPFSQPPTSPEESQQSPYWDFHSSKCNCLDCALIIPDARPRVWQHRAQAMDFYGRRARRQHRIIRERFVLFAVSDFTP